MLLKCENGGPLFHHQPPSCALFLSEGSVPHVRCSWLRWKLCAAEGNACRGRRRHISQVPHLLSRGLLSKQEVHLGRKSSRPEMLQKGRTEGHCNGTEEGPRGEAGCGVSGVKGGLRSPQGCIPKGWRASRCSSPVLQPPGRQGPQPPPPQPSYTRHRDGHTAQVSNLLFFFVLKTLSNAR